MIAFTLCSNNYLPKARILVESIRQHNPEVRIVLGLVDQPDSGIDYKALGAVEIVPVEDIGIPDFDEMVMRYDLVDLNTAVKPFYFRYLFENHADEPDLKIAYFDPDIEVYAGFGPIEDALSQADVLLTPHVLSPIDDDGKHPSEHAFLAFGLYNLGFCAMRRSPAAEKVIRWWSAHLMADCRYDPRKGMFVDQAWMDLAPIFFEEVEVIRHPGLNVAYWNLHERQLTLREGAWQINDRWPLVFFHFSDLVVSDSDAITKTATRFTLTDRPELKPLFQEYRAKLAAYDLQSFRSIPCAYVARRSDRIRQEEGMFWRRHPLQFLIALIKRCLPKGVKALVRGQN